MEYLQLYSLHYMQRIVIVTISSELSRYFVSDLFFFFPCNFDKYQSENKRAYKIQLHLFLSNEHYLKIQITIDMTYVYMKNKIFQSELSKTHKKYRAFFLYNKRTDIIKNIKLKKSVYLIVGVLTLFSLKKTTTKTFVKRYILNIKK
ncbi:hypothetical protein BpHYR1_003162 [Brachionus plicatilis]|uniref:Uncharacterized protein n=1 Tax=Brachionus plicatilis TaxID=10195 RepID=A0A3M7SLC8_BRAPC|nr:hypothetical protein BpHYR1_003162 [Brachionus plicatilis]